MIRTGESRYDVAARVEQLFDRLYVDQEKHGIEDVIIVAHGTTCRAFAMMWLRRTPEVCKMFPLPRKTF